MGLEALGRSRVLQECGGIATRYCGRLLAALGAEVVEARAPDHDDGRIGFGGDAGVAYGRWLDGGKRLETAGLDEVLRAQGPFDLVVAGQDREAVDRAQRALEGHDDASLLVAVTWFAAGGPYETWLGNDEVIQALTGIAYGFGPPAGPPTIPQGHAPQVMAGTHAANLAMAVLLAPPGRRPQRVDVDVLETALCLSEVAAVGAIDDPSQRAMRLGVNRYSPTYPCSSYRTADGWAGVTCLTPGQWRSMCSLIERDDAAADPRFRTSFRRLLLGDEVDGLLAPAFSTRTTDEWVRAGIAHRIPIAPMRRPADLPGDPHWAARRSFGPFDATRPDVVGPTLPFRATPLVDPPRPAPARAVPSAATGPLAGVRVVDFTMGWAGPQATRLLGDLGADVVKIESEAHPDWYRGWEADRGGHPPAIEVRASFNTLNRNKRGIVVELGSDVGRAQALRLIAGADVVIENFAAGVLDRLGLTQAEQRRVAPTVVSLSMPAFGNGGPLSGVRAYGSTVEQASGMPFVNGDEAWPPSLQHVAYGDAVAGLYAATAVLAGLHARRRHGGIDLDLAQVACLFQVGADAIIGEQVEQRPLPRTGSRRSRLARCEVVGAGGEDTWLLVATDEVSALPDDLPGWAASRTARRGAEELQGRGIAAAPVLPVHEIGSDPHLAATGFWETMDRRYVGRHTLGAPAFRLDGRRPVARRPAPTLGEHTAEVTDAAEPWAV